MNGTREANTKDLYIVLLATRKKALSIVASSKAGTEPDKATKKALWGSMGDSVIEESPYFDKLEASK